MANQIMRRDPMREMATLRDEVDRLFDDFYGLRYRRGGDLTNWVPPIDVEETEDAFVLRSELPGINRDDVKITVSGNEVQIRGKKKHESEDSSKKFHRVERSYGEFRRAFALPTNVLAEKARATYKDGVMQLMLPKAESSKTREVKLEG